MKILARVSLAAVATAGLIFAGTGPADAVGQHEHCLYTPSPEGYVLIAEGVSVRAYDAGGAIALDMFHEYVHRGTPGDVLDIQKIEVEQDCSVLLTAEEVAALTAQV